MSPARIMWFPKLEDARDDDQDQVPPRKKVRASRHRTLFDMCAPTRSSPAPQPTSPYSAARARRVKIYSKQEVDECIGIKSDTDNSGAIKQKNSAGATL